MNQSAVLNFFNIEHWEEAVIRFGTMVPNEKLLRFTVSKLFLLLLLLPKM